MKPNTKGRKVELSDNALKVLERRYLMKDGGGNVTETPETLFRRVARNISEAELRYTESTSARQEWEDSFYDVMSNLDFLPNSPTLMNAGTELQQLSACFVLPVEDTMESIFESVKNAALIQKSGGGTGFSFSRLRPQDDVVRSTKGVSSGPVSFMKVFDAATEAVKQGGRRRGANMAILRVDHPDIMKFIVVKKDRDRLTNFNLSVAFTDAFMKAVAIDGEYDLISPRDGSTVGRLSARGVFNTIIDSAWENGEPGIVFIDRINKCNPTPQLGPIESTNPCGEQPLLPYESCNLGSVNLSTMVEINDDGCRIDYDKLRRVVSVAVRFLDNVIDMNHYPIPQIEAVTKANRKIGLGVMGFADMLIQLGIPYDSDEAIAVAQEVMEFIETESKSASAELARERGAFPNFEGSIHDREGAPPVRNATTTTIAPTGSISIIANTSSGVEPVFALVYVRNVMDGDELIEVNPVFKAVAEREEFYDHGLMKRIAGAGSVESMVEVPEQWRRVFRTAYDIAPEAHVRIQAAFQTHTDNAVSKTVNLPKDASREDVAEVFGLAYKLGCKGLTIYRDGSREEQVLNVGTVNRKKSHLAPQKRPEVTIGRTEKMPTGCGNLYVTINDNDDRPFELFAQIGKAGGCAASQTEAIGRLVSLALRAGVEPGSIVRQLRGVRCPSPARSNGTLILSCADAISRALERHLAQRSNEPRDDAKESVANLLAGVCIDCGNILEFDGGCSVCRLCGYSKCS